MTLVVNTSTTINGDQPPGTGVAIDYGADNITVTINTAVGVVSLDNSAITSSRSGSILVNVGNIASLASAVRFSGANGFIQNESGRYITGAGGIEVNGSVETISNFGNIVGLTEAGVVFGLLSSAVTLTNRGDIYGRDEGVFAASMAGGGQINNEGSIRSDTVGIFVGGGTLPTFIINSGTISGTDVSIRTVGTAAIGVTNTGTLNGSISCALATGNDEIFNSGTINGVVALGDGNDIFNGIGGKSGAIFGHGGNDSLIGGKGGDILWGGDDLDIFKFVKVKETGKGANRDVIMDFGDVVGEKIDLIDIDAKKGPGNQDFKFIGGQKFHHKAGELHMLNKSGFVLIEGDINGDGKADFQIEVHGLGLPDKGDFLGVF